MYVDIKYTVWDRVQIDHKERTEVMSYADKNKISSPEDLYGILTDPNTSIMMDTAEFIEPEENSGQPTIEIFNEEGKSLWNNSPIERDRTFELSSFMRSARNHLELTNEEENFLHQIANDLYNQVATKFSKRG